MIAFLCGELTFGKFDDGTIQIDRPNSYQNLRLTEAEAAELVGYVQDLLPGPTRRQCWFMAVRWYLDDPNVSEGVDIAIPEIDEMLTREYARGAWPDAAAETAIAMWNSLDSEDKYGQANED